ncbi:glycosyltransferase [Microbacterium proteolyticum]|uniref:glycosyltransferase n=1 Tax=Microbacterium proteolyticum TaxID=1572644 RepID=UPI001FAD824E|nr:glycosyltransferase [Microbacterium proteolyticum]MCI9859341.1 glycosyltransferase [Microbacterium proteolyticum]
MDITHVQSSFIAPLGGAESYVLALATEQARRGDDVEIVTAWTDPLTVERANQAGVRVRTVRVRRPYRPDQHGGGPAAKILFHSLDLIGALAPTPLVLDVQKPGRLVHVHRFQGLGGQVLRARLSPVVHTAHDYCLVDTTSTTIRDGLEPDDLGDVQRLRARAIWRAARHASILVFPSERTLARHRALGMPRDGVEQRVVPHGWPAPAAASPPVDPSVRPRFVFLGKLQAAKGVSLLLRAWALLGVDAELVIAGDGPERPAVEHAAAAGLVTYAGWVDGDAKAALIASATALVFPSLWPETFGLVIAESLLMGRPVVATPQAAGSFVRDGENGLVSADATAEALAGALRRIARDASLRARLARGAAASATALDFGSHVDRVTTVYADAREIFARRR